MIIFFIPIIICTVLLWVAVAFAGYRAIKSFLNGATRSASIWLAIATVPFVLFAAEIGWAKWREHDRRIEVASFERHTMPKDHPGILEIHGYMGERDILILLDQLQLRRVYQMQSRPHRGKQRAEIYELRPQCRGLGRIYLDQIAQFGRLRTDKAQLGVCLKKDTASIDADRGHVPAILFLMGHQTTLRLQSNKVWASGNYEPRIRTPKASVLLDYWERPYLPRPEFPFIVGPYGFLQTGNTNWRQYRGPGKFKFFFEATELLKGR